jgi:hypothetical protein
MIVVSDYRGFRIEIVAQFVTATSMVELGNELEAYRAAVAAAAEHLNVPPTMLTEREFWKKLAATCTLPAETSPLEILAHQHPQVARQLRVRPGPSQATRDCAPPFAPVVGRR